MLRTTAAESAIFALLNIFVISWLSLWALAPIDPFADNEGERALSRRFFEDDLRDKRAANQRIDGQIITFSICLVMPIPVTPVRPVVAVQRPVGRVPVAVAIPVDGSTGIPATTIRAGSPTLFLIQIIEWFPLS
jgi:hypothetical protein